MIDLTRDGDVWVLRMDDGENRFNAGSVAAIHAALDTVEQTEGPAALVTTGSGKFYSNGLDLDWLFSDAATPGFIGEVYRLLGRVLAFPAYTVAAVNGHAFAGGAMLASAHDALVMRSDRGYWCVPEVDLGLPLAEPLYEVLAARVDRRALADAMITGRRFTAHEALAVGIVQDVATENAVLGRAIESARPFARLDRQVVAVHKQLLYRQALIACGVADGSP